MFMKQTLTPINREVLRLSPIDMLLAPQTPQRCHNTALEISMEV
jgi:hypothetical protein